MAETEVPSMPPTSKIPEGEARANIPDGLPEAMVDRILASASSEIIRTRGPAAAMALIGNEPKTDHLMRIIGEEMEASLGAANQRALAASEAGAPMVGALRLLIDLDAIGRAAAQRWMAEEYLT